MQASLVTAVLLYIQPYLRSSYPMYALGFAVPVEKFFSPFVVWVPLRFLMCSGTFHQWPYFVLAAVDLDYCLLFIIQYLGLGML